MDQSGLVCAVDGFGSSVIAGQLEDFVGPAKFLDFMLERIDLFAMRCFDARAGPCINFIALTPFMQRLRDTNNGRRDRFNSSPQRGVLPAMLLHHPHCLFTHLR